MTQQVADFFADTLADQPEDWHMMQPFFADRTPDDREADVAGVHCGSGWSVPTRSRPGRRAEPRARPGPSSASSRATNRTCWLPGR